MIDALSSLFGGGIGTGGGIASDGRKAAGRAAPAPPVGRSETLSESEKPANVAAVERIKEIGFSQWAEELRVRKIEEMRAEILAAMGLTERDLAGMDPDGRATVEQMIQQEIQERMAASSLTTDRAGVSTNQSGIQTQQFGAPGAANSPSAAGIAIGGTPGTGVSLGPAAMTVLINAQASQTGNDPARQGQPRLDQPPPGQSRPYRSEDFA